jgi:OOP family OmpA-OmpF porin
VTDERNQRGDSISEIAVLARNPASPLEPPSAPPSGPAAELTPAPVPPPRPAERRRIVLRGIRFAFDSARISDTDGLILDVALVQLQTRPDLRVRVVGHTDHTGPAGYNKILSRRRAGAVRDLLVQRGIARERFEIEGRGESQPVASNETRDGRTQNRRVELEVLE